MEDVILAMYEEMSRMEGKSHDRRDGESMKSFSEEWEKIHSTQEWGKYPSEQVIRFVARNYYNLDREQIEILDFGCGGGAHTWFLAREGFDVYAFDGSKSAVEKSKKYLEKEGFSEVHFSVQDGVDIGYDRDFFDCVIDSACVYANEIQAIKKMYENIYRVLKKGGKLYSSGFGRNTDGYGKGVLLEEGTYIDITEGVLSGRAVAHFYLQEEMETILNRIGFCNIKIDHMLYTDNGSRVEIFYAVAEKPR